MSNEEEKRCPLCAEEMDWTDQQFKPCKCGYQVCVWCWHQIMDMAEKDESEGRCPACRSAYEKDKIVAMQTNCERAVTKNCNKKSKPPKAKPKATEVKKDLTNVRVIQRKMAYIVGLPLSVADENVLLRKEYFGQYGKIMKISLSRSSTGDIQQFPNETCSVYVTYSKEEEALRCIRSVHGFVLEGRFLRASFGTAKYCHAWLRNTPCINPACLYLHTIGPEEDSFGKDEIAAVHTRNRVQQMVGATDNVQRRCGDILPSPVEESSNGSSSFIDKFTFTRSSSDSAHSGNLTGNVGAPNATTSSVDIVERTNNSCADKDIMKSDDRRLLDLNADLSKIKLKEDTQFSDAYPISMQYAHPFSGNLGSRPHDNSNSKEFSDDLLVEDVLHHEDTLPKDPAKVSEDFSGPSVAHERNPSSSNVSTDQNSVHSHEDESSLPFTCVDSVLNERSNELKFQTSAKSDRIYRSSNSFSNEDIVKHLLRIHDNDLTKGEEVSSFDASDCRIVSDVFSKGFDSVALPRGLSEILDERDNQHRSSWNPYTSGKSGLPFAKEDGFVDQLSTHRSSVNNLGQVPINCLGGKDYGGNLEGYLSNSHYQAPTSPSLAPPGFSLPCRVAPPGFSTFEKTGRVQSTTPSGGLVKNSSFPNGYLHSPSIESNNNNVEIDLIDPAILSCGKPTARLENPGLFQRPPSFNNQVNSFEEEAKYYGNYLQPIQSTHKEVAVAAHIPTRVAVDGLSGIYGYPPPRLIQPAPTYDPSSLTQTPHQLKLGTGFDERIGGGLDKYFSGYGDLVYQMAAAAPAAGDIYNRAFNM